MIGVARPPPGRCGMETARATGELSLAVTFAFNLTSGTPR